MPKDDFDQGRQRYRGGECRRRHIPGGAWPHPSRAVKERALQLYVEGSSLSAVSRVTGVSVPAVRNWVKKGQLALGWLGAAEQAHTGGRPGGSRRWP